MALKNSQFDAVMRSYEEIRSRHEREDEARLREIRENIPGFRALETELIRRNAEAARQELHAESSSGEIQEEISRLRRKKANLLRQYGYPSDAADRTYDCPLCRDTGYINNRKCDCFRRISAAILQRDTSEGSSFQNISFSDFQISCYSDKIKDERTGRTDRENALEAYQAAYETAGKTGSESAGLILYGNTGLGKTFLSGCIASEVLKSGRTVLYFSAQELFDLLADHAFGRDPSAASRAEMVFRCDLLVIDDLGTELLNTFVDTQFFRIVNERSQRPCTTVISTNLTLQDLTARYTERIFSRLLSSYRLVRLTGEDIRMKKAIIGGKS